MTQPVEGFLYGMRLGNDGFVVLECVTGTPSGGFPLSGNVNGPSNANLWSSITDVGNDGDVAIVGTLGWYFVRFVNLSADRHLMLPAAPQDGEVVVCKDGDGSLALHNIIVDGNGHTIDGAATYTMTATQNGIKGVIGLQFDAHAPTPGWFLSAMAFGPATSNPATWTQADWYVDFVAGNDANPGTALLPVKTVNGGVVAKWGTLSPRLAQTTTLHIVTPQPLNAEQIVLEPILDGPVSFLIEGTPQLVAAGVAFGVLTAKNRATNAQFAGAGLVGQSAGLLVHNTDVAKDSWCFVRTSASGQCTQPLAPLVPGSDTVYFPAPAEVDTWGATDLCDVYDACAINLRSVRVKGGGATDAAFTVPALWLRYLRVLDALGTPANSVFAPSFDGSYAVVESCNIEPYVEAFTGTYNFNWVNCYMNGINALQARLVAGITVTYGVLTVGGNTLDADLILDGPSGFSGEVVIGWANLASSLAGHGGAEIRITQLAYGPGAVFYGLGSIGVQAGSEVWCTGQTWVSGFTVATRTLGTQAVGSAYFGGGTFADNIPLTSANLDLYNGLQDTEMGSRYAPNN